MESKLANTILRVCEVLNKNKVQFMIVGGAAVALHGYFRQSMNLAGVLTDKPDLDFWYDATYDNYFRLLNAIDELGQDVTKFKEEQTPNPKKSFFRYEFEDFTLDLLPELKASLKFKSSFKKREIVNLNNIDIAFICLEDLIQDKEANSRTKDLEDLKHLKNKKSDD